MASYAGYSSPVNEYAAAQAPPDMPTYPAAFGAAMDPPSINTVYGAVSLGADTITELALDGFVGPSVVSELDGFVYGKFYIDPTAIDSGQVITDKAYTVSIWNAHLHDRQFTGKSISQSGISLNNGALPIGFYPTETKTYTLTISRDGAPNVNATVVFTFSDSETKEIVVTGFRAAIWPFPPQIPLSENIKPSTWIFESENGKEQRGKLRDVPRRSFSFECLLTPAEWRNAQNMLRTRQAARWVLPSFEQAQFVSASYSIGATVITVDTTAAEYYVGGLACVWQDYQNWYVATILSKTASTVTLETGLDVALSGNLRIMPASICKMAASIQSDSDRPGNRKIKLQFDAYSGPDLSGASDAVSLNGYGVLTLPTEAQQVSETIKTQIWDIDYENGPAEWGTTRLRSLRSLPQRTTLMDRAAIYAFKQWVHTKHGAVPFWLPTRFKDFYLSQNLTAGAGSFRVVENGFFDYNYGTIAVALFYPDGTVDYRLVNAVTEYSATETTIDITGTTSNASTLTPAEVRICFLLLCRLDGDIKLQHSGYDADATYTVKEVMQ